jgi:hypothetical protein
MISRQRVTPASPRAPSAPAGRVDADPLAQQRRRQVVQIGTICRLSPGTAFDVIMKHFRDPFSRQFLKIFDTGDANIRKVPHYEIADLTHDLPHKIHGMRET